MLDSASGDVLLQLAKDNYRLSVLDVTGCALTERLVEGIALQCALNIQRQRDSETLRKETAVQAQAAVEVPACLLAEVSDGASNAGDLVLDDDVLLDEVALALAEEAAEQAAASAAVPSAAPAPTPAEGEKTLAPDATDAAFYRLPSLRTAQQCLASVSMCTSADRFTDQEFPAAVASLHGLAAAVAPACLGQLEWRRLSDLVPPADIVVCGKGPIAPNAVVRTRYFCSAANALRSLDLVRAATCVKAHPDLGLYVFRFLKLGKAVDVTVDDYVPCWTSDALALPAGTATGDGFWGRSAAPWPVATAHHPGALNDVWITLLEKAYAKLHGSYQGISRGSTAAALHDLTGGTTTKFQWALGDMRYHAKALYALIRRCIIQRGVTVLVKPSALTHMQGRAFEGAGLVPNAYYVVEGALPAGPFFAVRLSSPSAFHCWNGRFSRDSEEAVTYKAELKYETLDLAGAFFNELHQERLQAQEEEARVDLSPKKLAAPSAAPPPPPPTALVEQQQGSVRRARAARAQAATIPGNSTPSFWIGVEELAAFFSSLLILRHCPSDSSALASRSVSFRACIPTTAVYGKSCFFATNPAFLLQTAKLNTEVVLQASQPDQRLQTRAHGGGGGGGAPYLYPMGLQLIAVRSVANSVLTLKDLLIQDSQIVAKSALSFTRDVGLSLTLDGLASLVIFVAFVPRDARRKHQLLHDAVLAASAAAGGVEVLVRATSAQRFDLTRLPLRQAVRHLDDGWDAASAAGRLQPDGLAFLANPQYTLALADADASTPTSKVYVYMEQLPSSAEDDDEAGGGSSSSGWLHSVGILVASLVGKKVTVQSLRAPYAEVTHCRQRVVAVSFVLGADPVVLIPSTWNPREEGRFRLCVLHDRPVTLRRKLV